MGKYLSERVVYLTAEVTEEITKKQYNIGDSLFSHDTICEYMKLNGFIKAKTIGYRGFNVRANNHEDTVNITFVNKKFTDTIKLEGLSCETILE